MNEQNQPAPHEEATSTDTASFADINAAAFAGVIAITDDLRETQGRDPLVSELLNALHLATLTTINHIGDAHLDDQVELLTSFNAAMRDAETNLRQYVLAQKMEVPVERPDLVH